MKYQSLQRRHSALARAYLFALIGAEPEESPKRGTPISELSGRPGHPGYDKFKSIAASWGYD